MQYNGSIKNRLIIIIMVVTFFTALIGYGSSVFWYMNKQHKQIINSSKTVSLVLAQDIAKLILLNDVSAAADISSALKSFSNLKSMVLYKADGTSILQYSIDNKSFQVDKLPKDINSYIVEDNQIKLYVEATYKQRKLGYIQFVFEIESIAQIIKKNIKGLILILGLMFILSYILATFFAKKFTNPILNLVKFLEKIGFKEFKKHRIVISENNEYGKLYDEVNSMLSRLDNFHEKFKIAAVTFQTQNGITITDKYHNILQVNRAFTQITGYEEEEVIGKTPKILQSGIHDKEFYDDMKNTLKEKNFWIGEITNRRKDGSIVNEHLTIHTVLDNNNEPLYYVASFLDITLLKETKAQLEEKENLLIQKSKMAVMGEMIENIAHQWRQPLSVISTVSTGMLLKKDLDLPFEKDEEIDQLNKINDTVKYLSHTIDDFREFFKLNKQKDRFNFKDCYRKVLNLTSSKFTTLNIEVLENLEDVEIETYENELIQVIINILNNAKDVLQEKPREVKKLISIKLYKEDNRAILSITDNGGGIPEDIINKIFDPYFTTKEKDGTGIGLNMSREIVEKHMDGKLTVQNTTLFHNDIEYKGANFTISIPLKK